MHCLDLYLYKISREASLVKDVCRYKCFFPFGRKYQPIKGALTNRAVNIDNEELKYSKTIFCRFNEVLLVVPLFYVSFIKLLNIKVQCTFTQLFLGGVISCVFT